MNKVQEQSGEPNQFGIGLTLGVMAATLLALPALYHLLVALQEAFTTGLVSVSPTSRGAPSQQIPWTQAWAHFLGLSLLVVGGLPLFLSLVSQKFRRALPLVGQVLAIIAAPLGIPLWLFSGMLVSLSGTLFVCSFFAFIAFMVFFDRRFGRVVTTLSLLSFVAIALFFYAVA